MQYVVIGLLAFGVLLLLININKIPGWIGRMKVFYSEVAFEMTKVVWPSNAQVINSTVLVGIVAVVLALMVGFVDSIFGKLAMLIFKG